MELKKLKLTKRRSELLKKYDVRTVEDVLRIYPLRYETIQAIPFSSWKEGDSVCFEGLISSPVQIIRLQGRRSMTRFSVISWDQEIQITLFNRPWKEMFRFGKTITCFGTYQGKNKVTVSQYNFRPLSQQEGIRPIYPLREGMKQSDMTSIMQMALSLADQVKSLVPQRYLEKYRLMDLGTCFRAIHQPQKDADLKAAIRTLKYEEFLRFQCVMQALSHEQRGDIKSPKQFDRNQITSFIQQFPYALTPDQEKAIDEVLEEMASSRILFRLVQGDVGCGKTLVASVALYACLLAGEQACFLAPTEILACQHFKTLKAQGLPVSLYVASLPVRQKKEILEGMQSGKISLVVGTHALFQEEVIFKDLGLAVIDEQQRFGVRQRRALLEKGKAVDVLMMSATPIPRTAAHFLFGDLSVSNIKTMPPGRKPVITHYVPGKTMKPILPEILQYTQEGHQGYVVCPSIEDSQEMDLRNAISIYEGMKKTLTQFRFGLLHGRLKAEEKEAVMMDFVQHKIDILVSTTVVEVGVDVANATWMVIYDAHRFGLSTLHQLRGRVGRSADQGHCFLLSATKDPQAIERLKMLEKNTDGFSFTAYDLQMRGPGDVLGVRQSGIPAFLFADPAKDVAMMTCCIEDAKEILQRQEDSAILAYVSQALENASYFD